MLYGKIPETSKAALLLDTVKTLSPLLNMEKGPWVAGGAIRRILKDIPNGGDIDIFFSKDNILSVDVVREFRKILNKPTLTVGDLLDKVWIFDKAEQNNKRISELKKVENIDHTPNVQLIMFEQYANVYDLLNSFDYTI